MSGRLIAVVGPSGVGKDSLIGAMAAERPELGVVRRVISRAPELGGEDFEPVSEARFAELKANGAFCLDWGAHGLRYGIPRRVADDVATGADRLCNLSRGVLGLAAEVFPRLVVLNVTASPETLARRLKGRGRETEAEIVRRLSRTVDLPDGLVVTTIRNDGRLEDAVAQALAALQPERA